MEHISKITNEQKDQALHLTWLLFKLPYSSNPSFPWSFCNSPLHHIGKHHCCFHHHSSYHRSSLLHLYKWKVQVQQWWVQVLQVLQLGLLFLHRHLEQLGDIKCFISLVHVFLQRVNKKKVDNRLQVWRQYLRPECFNVLK